MEELFKFLPQTFRQRRAGAAGGDGNRDPATPCQCRHNEVAGGRWRDAVNELPAAFSLPANGFVDRQAVRRRDDEVSAGQIAAPVGAANPADFLRQALCLWTDDRNLRAGREE